MKGKQWCADCSRYVGGGMVRHVRAWHQEKLPIPPIEKGK